MRGIPPCIKQQELKSNKAHIETRGIEKAEVLKWDSKITKLIEAVMYVTNPIKCTIIISEQLKWVVKEEKYSNVDTGKVKN